MDIASLAMSTKQASLENLVQISVMKIAMNDSQAVNDKMTQMIDNMAIDENLGKNIDLRI